MGVGITLVEEWPKEGRRSRPGAPVDRRVAEQRYEIVRRSAVGTGGHP